MALNATSIFDTHATPRPRVYNNVSLALDISAFCLAPSVAWHEWPASAVLRPYLSPSPSRLLLQTREKRQRDREEQGDDEQEAEYALRLDCAILFAFKIQGVCFCSDSFFVSFYPKPFAPDDNARQNTFAPLFQIRTFGTSFYISFPLLTAFVFISTEDKYA